MTRALLLASVLAACGGGGDHSPDAPDASRVDAAPAPDADTDDIATRLAALPGVTVTEQPPGSAPTGYRYFVLQVTQPVDHADPTGPTFQQEVSLIHRDVSAPMVIVTTGYFDYNLGYASEPTRLLAANQISIEHRYFGTSIPASPDWSKLTIEQMADDEHAIALLLKPIYGAAWISTGGSKGGMTASYHRRFFPDDVAGTVAYVAPMSFSVPDERYATFLSATGTEPCADAVRAAAREMLQHRRAAMVARATQQGGAAYTRIAIGPAVESAIRDLEWSFWQYNGVGACGSVPATTATDDQLFAFLDGVSPINFSDDDQTAEFEAYFYQAYAQLGSPGTVAVRGDLDHLSDLAQYTEADYAGSFPVGTAIPTFDDTAMPDVRDWIQTDGAHFAFVYGQYDPWTGGAYDVTGATDTIEVQTPQGTHDDGLASLATDDRAAVLAKLAAWTGVQPAGELPPGPRPPNLRDARRARHAR